MTEYGQPRAKETHQGYSSLCDGLIHNVKGPRCVLDGEIVYLDADCKPQFRDLLFRRSEAVFYAFYILLGEHAQNGEDHRLHERHQVSVTREGQAGRTVITIKSQSTEH